MAKAAELLAGLDETTRGALHRQVRISTIGATTRIENAVLTDAQIDWIDTILTSDGRPSAFALRRGQIQDKLAKDRERSLEEVAGCREMLALVHAQGAELFPLTQATVRGLHQELLRHHPPAAYHLGRYKVVPNSVVERDLGTRTERVVLATTDPGPLTDAAMAELVDWYNHTLPDHPWPVAVASEMVFRFLACHPFQDGNGRIGRALYLLTLLQSSDEHAKRVAPFLAVDRFIEQRRVEYYSALARTGDRYRPDPSLYRLDVFLAFMVGVTRSAVEAIAFYKERLDAIRDLPAPAAAILQCFKDQPENRLTPRVLRDQTKLPERTASRALHRLTDIGLLQRYGRGPAMRYQLVF
jgi:Fic family protein